MLKIIMLHLLVEVIVSRSNIFERQDMNIFSNANISYAIAALGGDVRIKTVDGDVLYTVAPGTQTGTRIRLKGKGVPSVRNKEVRGDQYVTLVVATPTGLSKEAKEALRRFDELTGGSLTKEGGASTEKKKKGFMDKISVIRILDSRREKFKLSKAYERKVDIDLFQHFHF